MKTVAYLRVSTRSQDLANQKLAILEFSQKRRFPIDQFIESLCGRAIEILREARMIGDAGPLVFTDRGGMPLDTKQFRRLLERCGIACVPHGFRSSFRDWAAEETDHPREVIEAALAHVVQNKVEAAYARSDLFERRRRLMNDWSAYLDGASGQVVAFRLADTARAGAAS